MDKKVEAHEVEEESCVNVCTPPPCHRTSSSPDKTVSGKSPDSKVRFSFEDELTFSPRLNSLSMKMVSEVNRPSITERKQEKKVEDPVNFAFKPNLSNNSSKIVAKMNTTFWDRQHKVVRRRLEMIEQGPSTIHPNLKYTASKEISGESNKKGGILTSLSEQTCTINASFNNKKKRCKSRSPYRKSVDVLIKLKKEDIAWRFEKLKRKCNNHIEKHNHQNGASCICSGKEQNKKNTSINRQKVNDETVQIKNNKNNVDNNVNTVVSELHIRNERYKKDKQTNVNRKIQVISPKTKNLLNKSQSSLDDIPANIKEKCPEVRKPLLLDKKRSSEKVISSNSKESFSNSKESFSNSKESFSNSKESFSNSKESDVIKETISNKSKPIEKNARIVKKHGRNFTYPIINKDRTNEMDAIHQNLIKMKKVAGQAVKKKKVFVCNGPYSCLRVALRKRGWIEKHFKSGHPSLVPQMSISNSYDEEGEETIIKHERLTMQIEDKDNENSDIETRDFMCDNQYGIMSRIVRKSMPIFLWTLRRDDIDFRYLHKDQIVNHFLSARAFTTKAGLCMTLNNLRYFEDLNASTFFPRCYRLCCDEEKEEFVEDYQITALQSILKIIVERHELWGKYLNRLSDADSDDSLNHDASDESKLDCKEKPKNKIILNTDVLRLVFKTSYEYLESKHHADIEESYRAVDEVQKKANWMEMMDYFKKLAVQDGVIAGVSEYIDECKRILGRMEEYHPQQKIDGSQNIWILKPGAKSRGRGIEIMNVLSDILNLSSDTVSKKENRWVIQKYIEKPFLIYRTKFDIRQWFLVTDWNPLMLWFYKDCYVRFCGQEFQLDKFDPQVHLSNNSIQKHFTNGRRSEQLPESNMWSSDEFKIFLQSRGQENYWDEVIYPGMKKAITAVLISSQDSLEYRKNSFELYGADFMLGEDLQPWLIEINASPALGPSTPVTERLCRNVLEDTLKVVLDRRESRECDTGQFELAFKRPYIAMPTYIGCTIAVDGMALKPLLVPRKKINPVKPSTKSPITTKISENSLSENTKSPISPKVSENSTSSESTSSSLSDDSLRTTTPKETSSNIDTKKHTTCTSNKSPVVQYTTRASKTNKIVQRECKNVIKKTYKPAVTNGNNGDIKKNKFRHESEILRALIEPRICTFPLGAESHAEAFRNLRNAHPCYRFSSPDELKNDFNDQSDLDNLEDLELFQPYKMRYRNLKNLHNTSLSRQFSLMTSEDVMRLKKRRWNSVSTEI